MFSPAYSQDVKTYNAGVQKHNRDCARQQFEQRLNLSDKQKQKAKDIHQKGREEMKPVMTKIDQKRREIDSVKASKMSDKSKNEKMEQLNSEMKDLQKQANEIRKKNSQEFEKILNKKQKTELEKMKSEGRANFEKKHPPRAPFGNMNSSGFLFKPLLPPPNDNSFGNSKNVEK